MELETTFHGTREFSEEDIIYFKKGIPGFENLKKFIVFDVEDNGVFSVLQSIEDKDIGIIVVSPFSWVKDYEFNLDKETEERLSINSSEEVLILNTVTLGSKLENVTINLRAPLIVNVKNKSGEQLILTEEKYEIKHPLFKEGV